jgi:hypothetical protein
LLFFGTPSGANACSGMIGGFKCVMNVVRLVTNQTKRKGMSNNNYTDIVYRRTAPELCVASELEANYAGGDV